MQMEEVRKMVTAWISLPKVRESNLLLPWKPGWGACTWFAHEQVLLRGMLLLNTERGSFSSGVGCQLHLGKGAPHGLFPSCPEAVHGGSVAVLPPTSSPHSRQKENRKGESLCHGRYKMGAFTGGSLHVARGKAIVAERMVGKAGVSPRHIVTKRKSGFCF